LNPRAPEACTVCGIGEAVRQGLRAKLGSLRKVIGVPWHHACLKARPKGQRMRTWFVFASLVFAVACGKGKDSEKSEPATTAPAPATTAPSSGDAVAKAQEIFTQRCVPCHGSTGIGDGPASASLDPKPRAFSDPAWQASVTDEHIEKIIKFGGAAVGKSVAMPPNPDLNDPAVITELRKIVRGFKK